MRSYLTSLEFSSHFSIKTSNSPTLRYFRGQFAILGDNSSESLSFFNSPRSRMTKTKRRLIGWYSNETKVINAGTNFGTILIVTKWRITEILSFWFYPNLLQPEWARKKREREKKRVEAIRIGWSCSLVSSINIYGGPRSPIREPFIFFFFFSHSFFCQPTRSFILLCIPSSTHHHPLLLIIQPAQL